MTSLLVYATTDESIDETLARAESEGRRIGKYADPTEGPREGLSTREAARVAEEDPGLIWVE